MGMLTKQKNSISKNTSEVSSHSHRPNYSLQVTKKISTLGYFFIGAIYTIAVVVTTVNIVKKDNKRSSYAFNDGSASEEILAEIKTLKQNNVEVKIDQKLNNHLEKFRSELIDEVNRMNLKYVQIMEANEIVQDKILKDLSERGPASVKLKSGKAIVYNKANERVLRFMHKKEYKRLKESYDKKRIELIPTLDLTTESGKMQLQNFDDDVEVSLYELKQTQRMQRDQFKEKQYIVRNP